VPQLKNITAVYVLVKERAESKEKEVKKKGGFLQNESKIRSC
tara:strand:- start:524 stop:649 length:126 start_codon:yes stop_codon:yes gene_type:complete